MDTKESSGDPESSAPGSAPLKKIKWERFAIAFASGKNHAHSYLAAGFETKSAKVGAVCGERLARHPLVAARISHLQKEASAKLLIDREGCLMVLVGVIHDLKAKTGDRLKAIEILLAAQGWDRPEQQPRGVTGSILVITDGKPETETPKTEIHYVDTSPPCGDDARKAEVVNQNDAVKVEKQARPAPKVNISVW